MGQIRAKEPRSVAAEIAARTGVSTATVRVALDVGAAQGWRACLDPVRMAARVLRFEA